MRKFMLQSKRNEENAPNHRLWLDGLSNEELWLPVSKLVPD
jgi:hypothetical protein